MSRIIAKLILLPVRLDLYRARFYIKIIDFLQSRVDAILKQYE